MESHTQRIKIICSHISPAPSLPSLSSIDVSSTESILEKERRNISFNVADLSSVFSRGRDPHSHVC